MYLFLGCFIDYFFWIFANGTQAKTVTTSTLASLAAETKIRNVLLAKPVGNWQSEKSFGELSFKKVWILRYTQTGPVWPCFLLYEFAAHP